MTLNLIVNRAGELETEIDNHGDAFVIGETMDGLAAYLVTPDTGHVWHDARGSRCADLGEIDCPTLPADDAAAEEWEQWAASCVVRATESGVRID